MTAEEYLNSALGSSEGKMSADDFLNQQLGTPQQPAEEEGFLRQALDFPVNIFKGGVTGTRMVTDVFGASNPVSEALAGVEDYMDTLLSAQARQDQQTIARILKDAEDKGVLDQVMAGVEAFSVAPADTLANALGTMIPVLATGLAGSVARLAPVAIKGVQFGLGVGMGAGLAKGEIYNAVYSELENQGYDPETASKAASEAQAYNGKNLDTILLNAGLGGLAATRGAEKILTNIITKSGGKLTGGAIEKALKVGITEGGLEGLQGGTERGTTNIALQREGVDVPTMRGVVAQATMEGIAGLGLGAAVGPLQRAEPDDVAEQRKIEAAANKVSRELSVDPNDANGRGIVNETNRLEQKIENNKVMLSGMEPTSREHQRLSLEIAEDQKNLAALKGAVEKVSEPIAAEQARLAREIAAKSTTPAALSTEVKSGIRSGVASLDPDIRELYADQLTRKLEKKGKLTWQDVPQELNDAMDTIAFGALKQALDTNPQEAISIIAGKPAAPVSEPITPTISETQPTSELVGAEPTQPTIREVSETSPIVGAEPAAIVEQEPVAPEVPAPTPQLETGTIQTQPFQVTIPDATGQRIARMETIEIPMEWDAEINDWLMTEEGSRMVDETKQKGIAEQKKTTPKTYAQLENEALDIQNQISTEAGVLALIGVSDNNLTISGLESREKGKGAKALEIITSAADKNQTTITLKAEPKGGDVQRLKKLYSRFGFVDDPNFAEGSNRMIRFPAAKPSPAAPTPVTTPPVAETPAVAPAPEVAPAPAVTEESSKFADEALRERDKEVGRYKKKADAERKAGREEMAQRYEGMIDDLMSVPANEFKQDVIENPAYYIESNVDPFLRFKNKEVNRAIKPAPTPAAAPTPTAPAVGNRIKLGKSPQTYTIEEIIPQTDTERELGEQYYSVTNERTGEVQTVEANDLKPVKAKGVRKVATRVKDESLVVPEAERYTFEQAEAEARKLFGGMPEGFVIVNDSVDKDFEFKAGYEPSTGDIILNLAYIRKGESVRNLIAHELGHYAAGDPEIRAKLQEFLDALPATTRAKLERFVERVYDDETGDIRLEEKQVRAFVQMLKAGENRNAFQKILDAIKKWLNDNLGTNFQPTDMDAAAVLSGSIDRFVSGEKIAREDGEMREAKVERDEDVKKDIAIAEQIQSVVNATIGKMPQDQARDYNAFVNEGKSEAQIAQENNTSVNQVRTNIVRGKKEVGDAIKKAKIDTKAKPENAVLEWTTGAVKKYFTKEGDLPGGTFQNWVRRNAKLAREAEEARQATQDFYEGLRKLYKINKINFILNGLSSIPPEDVASFNDALAGEIPINQMPLEIQEPLTRMRQHIDAMSSDLIATGQLPEYLEAKAMNNLGVYLTRSYKIFSDPKWIDKIPQEKLNAARNFLYQQQSKTDPNFTIEDADRKLEQMLNDWAGEKDMGGRSGGRLGAKDLSVMMTRSEVPKQLRDVMGENTNIIFNYANTISKISRFVADQQFLDAVKKEGAGKFLFTKDAAPKGFNTLIAPEESRTMSPLSGLRTTPEIAKAFEEFGKAYDAKSNPVLHAFGWLNAVGKANLTVGSLLTQARNLIGQPFFFLANGHADLRAINREVERIMKSKGLSKDKARNELVKMAAGEGLVNENAYAGELKEAFEQIGLKTFEDMDADEFSRQFLLLRLFKKGTQGAQKVYQKTDELGKIIGWLNETNRIEKMNPGMSRQDAMAIASERTRNTYPTYSQGSEALRLFRRQPFFGPFATFFYETFRTTYWNAVYAFQDINSGTEAGKQEGIKRLAGTMAQIAIGAYLVNAISAMVSGIGDQEEEDVRRMLPPWAENASLVWFPKTKDGVYNFINFSYLNPYNALTDPFVRMISGFSQGEDPIDIFIESAGTFLEPFASEQPVTAATVDVLRNVTERGTKVYNEEDDLSVKTSKILLHVFGKAFTPGTIDRLRRRIIPALYGETVGSRAPEPFKEISAEFTGVRFENVDMRQAFQNKAWEFNKAQNDSERIFRDVATRRRRVTEEDQIEAYRRAEESRFENWQEMYRNYMAVRRAGASKQEAVRLMTDIKISKREASYIARGKYVPYEVSDEVKRRSKLNGNVVPLQEIKAIAREMPRVLQDVR